MRKQKLAIHKSKEDILSEEEVEEIIKNSKTIIERLVVITLIYTGLRVSEFIHLKKDWIDWQREKIQVPLKIPCDCKDCLKFRKGVWSPKTRTGQRKIPLLDERAKTILRSWFTINDNINLTPSGVWGIVKRVAKRANITHKVYPHALRATAAQIFCQKYRLSAATLQYIMGWKDITIAISYIRPDEQRALEEIDQLQKRGGY